MALRYFVLCFKHRRWLRTTAYVFVQFLVRALGGRPGHSRTEAARRLCGDCTENVQFQCSCRVVSAGSAWKSYGAGAAYVQTLRGDWCSDRAAAIRRLIRNCRRLQIYTHLKNVWPISRRFHGQGAAVMGLPRDGCSISTRFHGYCTNSER